MPQNNSEPFKLISFESQHWLKNHKYIAGIDEAGRGPLAGPMVVSAVVINSTHFNLKSQNINENISEELLYMYQNINDSKKVSAKKRFVLYDLIKKYALDYSIVEVSKDIIDQKGISQATQFGFFSAYSKLKKVNHILTDNFSINMLKPTFQTNIVKGDQKSVSIAAASILAKVHRDNIMIEYSKTYPLYQFEKHKGYGTKAHISLLTKHGPCEIHRKSFEPVKTLIKSKKL